MLICPESVLGAPAAAARRSSSFGTFTATTTFISDTVLAAAAVVHRNVLVQNNARTLLNSVVNALVEADKSLWSNKHPPFL